MEFGRKKKKEEPKPEKASRVFEVKPENLNSIRSALQRLGVMVRADESLGMIVVQTEPELMPAVEQIVRRLNTAAPVPTNVEITVYLLEASREPPAAATNLPPDLNPTVTQLRSVFAYQHFRLLDTAVVRSRSMTTAYLSGVLSFGKDDTTRYQLRFRPTVVGDEKTRSIRIDDLRFETSVPVRQPSPPPSGVQTSSPRAHAAIITADIE